MNALSIHIVVNKNLCLHNYKIGLHVVEAENDSSVILIKNNNQDTDHISSLTALLNHFLTREESPEDNIWKFVLKLVDHLSRQYFVLCLIVTL